MPYLLEMKSITKAFGVVKAVDNVSLRLNLAKVMRTECRKRKIKHLKVVYSKEPVMTPIEDDSISCKDHCICPPGTQRKCTARRTVPGSNAFVPSVAGLIIGGEVVKDLVGFVPLKG